LTERLWIEELSIDVKRGCRSEGLELKSRRKSELKYLMAAFELASHMTQHRLPSIWPEKIFEISSSYRKMRKRLRMRSIG
jgi:hypothetical protein